MIRAMFFDLDGTLLTSQKTISPKTRLALEKCGENGVKLFLATARPPRLKRMLSWDEDTLALFDGGLYYNGACVELGARKEYITFPDNIVKKIIECVCYYDKLNICLQLENEGHAFRFPLEDRYLETWGITPLDVFSLTRAQSRRTVKILIFHANLIDSTVALDEKLVASVEGICKNAAQMYLTNKNRSFQLTAQSVNKLNGVEKIRRALGYDKREIAVFGDDINDVEMIAEYEYGVAMGNADETVKSAAKYVTLDNDSNGVEYAIREILRMA